MWGVSGGVSEKTDKTDKTDTFEGCFWGVGCGVGCGVSGYAPLCWMTIITCAKS